jgi:type IV pilus assembly protein PilV
MRNLDNFKTPQSGFSMMEILVTLFIIMVGLLGIIALQGKAQIAELEAYQRSQALIVLSDLVDRMNSNRATLSCFIVTTDTTNGKPYIGPGTNTYGTPTTCAASITAYNNRANEAIKEIHNFFKGTSEQVAGGDVAAMINGRACISYDAASELGGVAGTGLYTVIVAWQAMGDLPAPVNMNCAVNEYGPETKRRAVSTTFRIANLY